MSISADFDGSRKNLHLRSTKTDAAVRIAAAERMPDECEAELRTALDGAILKLSHRDNLELRNVLDTPSNRVRVFFQSEINEGAESVTYSLWMLAGDMNKPGTCFRLDPNEICLLHKPTETTVWGRWNPKFHRLEFSELRMKNEYVVVFTTATGGVLAAHTLPPVPQRSGKSTE